MIPFDFTYLLSPAANSLEDIIQKACLTSNAFICCMLFIIILMFWFVKKSIDFLEILCYNQSNKIWEDKAMSMVIGIGGVSGGKKSTTAKLFDEELTAMGYKTAWPKKYIVRPQRKTEDPNTICVSSESEIPKSVTKWSIDGKIVGYDIEEIKQMLANDIWPIVLSSNLELLFDIKKNVELDGKKVMPEPSNKVEEENKWIFEQVRNSKFHFMRIFYCSSYFTSGDLLKKVIDERSDISDKLKDAEFKKRSAEIEFYKQQIQKYSGYLVLPKNVIITKIFDEDVVRLEDIRQDIKIHLLHDKTLGPKIFSPIDIDNMNKFFLSTNFENIINNEPNLNNWLIENIEQFVDQKIIYDQEKFEMPSQAVAKERKED